MTQELPFHAEKPLLATHPVAGGDALIFPISPPPPQWWWRALRQHAGANPALLRPWDREQESQIAVVCPSVADLPGVIDAIDACVAQANRDYGHERDLQRACATKLNTDEADRDQYLHDIQNGIDDRYDRQDVRSHDVRGELAVEVALNEVQEENRSPAASTA